MKAQVYGFISDGGYYKSDAWLAYDKWHHCVMTFDNGIVTGYIDGVLDKVVDLSDKLTSVRLYQDLTIRK